MDSGGKNRLYSVHQKDGKIVTQYAFLSNLIPVPNQNTLLITESDSICQGLNLDKYEPTQLLFNDIYYDYVVLTRQIVVKPYRYEWLRKTVQPPNTIMTEYKPLIPMVGKDYSVIYKSSNFLRLCLKKLFRA